MVFIWPADGYIPLLVLLLQLLLLLLQLLLNGQTAGVPQGPTPQRAHVRSERPDGRSPPGTHPPVHTFGLNGRTGGVPVGCLALLAAQTS